MPKVFSFLSTFSLRKLLYNRKFTVPFSILLAFIIWLLIVTKENPIIERTFANMTVNVNLEGTTASKENMQIINDISSQKFTIVVRGPTYLVSSLKTEDFYIYASAAAITESGEHMLDVVAMPQSPNKGYEVLSVSPSKIKVTVDQMDEKVFNIVPDAPNIEAKDDLVIDPATVSGSDNATVKIHGPKRELDKIASVKANVSAKKKLSATKTFSADIKLYDKKDKEIKSDNLTLSQTKVDVTVPISKEKEVPIKAVFTNLPEGFDTKTISYDVYHEDEKIKTVTIKGKPEEVDKITELSLSEIDISEISASNNSFDVKHNLHTTLVYLKDNIDVFRVKINTQNYIQRTFNLTEFSFKNLSGEFLAEATPIKNIKVFGPRAAVNKLKKDNVYAVIDLADKNAGKISSGVIVSFKGFDNVWALGKYESTVTIKKK